MTQTRPAAPLSRRRFLATGLAGCSLAASPLVTPITLAHTGGDARLVVIILRGGMDGLDVVRPWDDPGLARLRPDYLNDTPGPALSGMFSLHPELAPLMPLWRDGTLGFVHAVSTPYRDKRSHFEGQDILEAGLPALDGARAPASGWLNRLLAHMPGTTAETAYAVGHDGALILRGSEPATMWFPQSVPGLSPQGERLLSWLYDGDPLFHPAAARLFDLMEDAEAAGASQAQRTGHLRVADYVAARLRDETRIATFSLSGWDTHGQQHRTLRAPLRRLSETILTLRDGLGPALWGQTAVLAMTEFGRTVRLNGTGGTDHGTGGAMLLAGGAVRGGTVHARWPGLGEGALYEGRDLMPTADVRAYAAASLAALFGISRSALETDVFPGLDLDERLTIIR